MVTMNCRFDQNVIFCGTQCFKHFFFEALSYKNPNIYLIHSPNTCTAIFVIQIFTEVIKQPSGSKLAEDSKKNAPIVS